MALETVTPPGDPTPPSPDTTADESLASHAEQYAQTPWQEKQAEDTDRGDKRPRHRARSQRATPEDVPRIAELTKKLRTAEEELQRLKAAPAAQTPVPEPAVPRIAASSAPKKFDTPAPKREDFANDDDPYAAFVLATARWERQKEASEQSQQAAKETEKQASERYFQDLHKAYAARVAAFEKDHPDYGQVMTGPNGTLPLTPILQSAILTDDNGPAFVYHLAQHPEAHAEAFLLTQGREVTDASVASLRRWLTSRVQAGTTGSAAATPSQTVLAPRPPNPVRTGPLKSGDDLPGDDSSLAAHAKAFHRRR